MAAMAIILTLLAIANVTVAYLFICQKALERSLAEDKVVWPAIVPVGQQTFGKIMPETPAPEKVGRVLDPKPAAKKPRAKAAATKAATKTASAATARAKTTTRKPAARKSTSKAKS